MAAISAKARSRGLKCNKSLANKKYSDTDEGYFDSLSPAACYWAGFIAADGCIGTGTMLQVYQSDKEHLVRFTSAINYTGPILERFSPLSYRSCWHVNVYSARIVDSLWRLFGVGRKKSLTLQPPPPGLTRDQQLAYVTGYLDGDGYIAISGAGHLTCGMVGTKLFLEWVRSVVGVPGCLVLKPKSTGLVVGKSDTYQLGWTHGPARQVLDTLSAVHGTAGCRLPRKWEKYYARLAA